MSKPTNSQFGNICTEKTTQHKKQQLKERGTHNTY